MHEPVYAIYTIYKIIHAHLDLLKGEHMGVSGEHADGFVVQHHRLFVQTAVDHYS